jgi:hypothetical protein
MISRRGFLRCLGGAAIALPFLEATHGKAWAQGSAPILRHITFFRPGGTISNMLGIGPIGTTIQRSGPGSNMYGDSQPNDYWAPTKLNTTLQGNLGPIHSALINSSTPVDVSKLLVLTGIDNHAAMIQSEYNGGHGPSERTALTSATYISTSAGDSAGGPSIDQAIAQFLQSQNPMPFTSMPLMVDDNKSPNYSNPFLSAANQDVTSQTDPIAAFAQYFKGVKSSTPDPKLLAQQNAKTSVLNGAMDGYRSIERKLSGQDRQVVAAHLQSLSQIENAVNKLSTIACSAVAPTISDPGKTEWQFEFEAQFVGNLMADMIVSAMACGLTQVASLYIGDMLMPWLGEPYEAQAAPVGDGHGLHHEARSVGNDATQTALWLKEMLLDNSLMMYTSEFSNGSLHSSHNVPILMAGSAGGYFKTGRNVDFNIADPSKPYDYLSNTGTHNLYTSMLNAFGSNVPHFGMDDSTLPYKGPIPGLKA